MKVLSILVLCITLCYADEAGRYESDNSGAYNSIYDDGRYIPDNSGQYIHDNSGAYRPDGSGRYSGDKSGDYRDKIEKYRAQQNLLSSSTNTVRQVVQPKPIKNINKNQGLLGAPTVVKPIVKPVTAKPFVYDARKEGNWKILRQATDIDAEGTYHWEYETENKIQAEESGKLHNVGTDAEAIRAKGFYKYTGPDNVVYEVQYTADENGFVPQGVHLPKSAQL